MATVACHDAWMAWRQTYDGKIAHSIVGLDTKYQVNDEVEWLNTHMLQACWKAYEAGFKAGERHGLTVAVSQLEAAVAKMKGE